MSSNNNPQEDQSKPDTGPPIPFSSLPHNPNPPEARLNAWGLYGPWDERGFLNRQTPAIVAAAAQSEIRTGVRVLLDAPLDFQAKTPLFSRQVFVKNVYRKKPRFVHDDTWSFNTQSSTQWDGLRHFGYQKAGLFYNGVTVEDIAGESDRGRENPGVLGIQNGSQKGICGRGVLVDFARWKETEEGKRAGAGEFESFKTSPIKLEWLKATLRHQNTEVRYGDVLIVRSGFFPSFYALEQDSLEALQKMSPPNLGGVEQSDAALQWIWENFSAVASDHPSFEQWPTPHDWSMHEVLLAGWGCNIGELLDLEELSKECEKQQRWSFFISSVPCNVPGGVASPTNAIAIF